MTWHDQWHADDPLVKIFGPIIVYDVVSDHDSKFSDYILEGKWVFPAPTSRVLLRMRSKLPILSQSTLDQVEWVPSGNGN